MRSFANGVPYELIKTTVCELIYFNTSLILISSFHILGRPDMVNASTIGFEFLSFFTIRITWERPNDNFNEINEYQLKIVLLSSISSSSPTAPVFEFNTPQPNFNYAINITACNDVCCGDVSETVKFTSITPSLSICLSICLCLSVYLFACLSVVLYFGLSICLSVRLSVCLSICLRLSVCLSVCLSVLLSACVCLSV